MVRVRDGSIVALGSKITVPAGATVVDADGRWLLPGFIDAHTHVGLHEEAEGWAGSDTNEMTDPVTAAVRALDAINPADLGVRRRTVRRHHHRQRQSRIGQPDRRPDGGRPHARPDGGRDGAALAVRA